MIQSSHADVEDEATSSFFEWANTFPEPLALTDQDGDFLSCNHAMRTLFDMEAASPEDLSLFDLLESVDAKDIIQSWDYRLVHKREPLTFVAASHHARSANKLLWKASPYRDGEEILVTVRDLVTELEGIDPASLGLSTSFSEKEAFDRVFTRISHDLHAPLRRIKTFGELVAQELEGEDLAEAQGYMDVILSNASRHNGLLDAMSHYFTFDIPAPFKKARATTWRDIIEQACDRAGFEAGQVTYAGAVDDEVHVEHELLVEVFEELFANTMRFARDPSKPKTVRVEVEQTESDKIYQIRFHDNGPGVHPGELEVMFEPFERLAPQPPKAEQGYGVGLALSRKRMKAMRGEIHAIPSEEGLLLVLHVRQG